jgi:hypothetical protein
MTHHKKNAYIPLLQDVSQFEVDFVIPRVGTDLPIGIDPFLLFKSRDPLLSDIHNTILSAFNHGIQKIRQSNFDDARLIFKFPEVSEIGLGYTKKGKKGAGVGGFLSELIIETMADSPALIDRGIKHIEEMQLVSLYIGPDRISDISANLIKKFLIEYTQKQCKIWNIPLVKNIPIEHILDPESMKWFDGYFDLPISPFDQTPILLVPRRIVRALPWINYEDFYRMEFSAFLRAKRVRSRLINQKQQKADVKYSKKEVVALSRNEVDRVDRYVSIKEADASQAQPSTGYIELENAKNVADNLKHKLLQLSPGREQANDYHLLVLEVLNFLFNPELIDGEIEVRTMDGTERRDIIFTNDSDLSFWSYLRSEHSGIFLMFEVKNTKQVESAHFNQTATYLGDRLGRLGFIVTRNQLNAALEKKAFSIYNDSHPRKIILVISDTDLVHMIDLRSHGNDPMRYIQKMYRNFRTRVQ